MVNNSLKSNLLILVLIIIILNHSNIANAYINEIMPNPFGSDNNKEYVEIKGLNNLTEFIIGDSASNDSLSLMNYCDECNYSLIVEEGYTGNCNCSIYSAGATIGNGLANSGDTVYLYLNSTLIDNLSYQDITEGYSYSLINNSWQEFNGTPCYENIVDIGVPSNSTINTSLNITNSTINLTINITNSSINTSLNITNSSVNITNSTINTSNGCNISLHLDLNRSKRFYVAGEKIRFKNRLINNEDYDYTITYWIEDYFGKILKSKINTSNEYTKQWTTKSQNNYLVAKVKNRLSYINCSNQNNNTEDEFQIIIINNKTSSKKNSKESSIDFEEVEHSDNYLYTKGEVYKGDTGKTLLAFRFECEKDNDKKKKSKYFKLYFDEKYSTNKFSFRMPLVDVIDYCYSDPVLTYSGLELEGEEDVDDFEFQYEEEVSKENIEEPKKEEIKKEKKYAKSFIYPKTESNIKISPYFLKITDKNELIQKNNSINKTGNKITSNIAKEVDVKYKPLSFLNFAIIILFISILLILILKKW